MRKIDAFAHILPRRYLDRLERQLVDTMSTAQLRYYREGVFTYDGAPRAVQCVLDFFGAEHVMFCTDTPLGPPSAVDATINDIEASHLDEPQRAAVFANNAARVLGITLHKIP